MSQLFLTVIGSAVGGPLGGAIGAALGAYLDKEFFFPPQDVEPPRTAGDQRTQGASEGMGLIYAIGPQVRVPGKIVYTGPRAIRVRSDGGVEEDILIDIGQGVAGDGLFYSDATSGWLRDVYANGQRIFNVSPNFDEVSNQVFARLFFWQYFSQGDGTNDKSRYRLYLYLYSFDPAVDLTQLTPGLKLEVQTAWGFPFFDTIKWQISILEGTKATPEVYVSEYGLPPSASSYCMVYSPFYDGVLDGHLDWCQNVADEFTEDYYNGNLRERRGFWGSELGVEDVSIFQERSAFDNNVIRELKIYPGTLVQDPEPLVEVDMGWAPERRGRAALSLFKLNKGKFGNTTPNFEVAYTHDTEMSVGEAVHELMQRHGVPAAYYDVSDLTQEFLGLVSEEPIDSLGLIQALMLAYQFDCREADGRLIFYRQDSRPIIEVPSEDLVLEGGRGANAVRGLSIEDSGDDEMPRRVEVVYTDADRDLIQSTARETHGELLGGSLGQVKRVRTPLTLTQKQAGVMARELMLATYQSRRTFTATLPPKYLEISEGDLLRFTGDQPLEGVVSRVELGRNGQVKVQGYRRFSGSATVLSGEVDIDDSDSDGSVIPVTPEVDPQQLDIMARSVSEAADPHLTLTLPALPTTYPGVEIYYTTQLDPEGGPAEDAQYLQLSGFVDPSRWSGRMQVNPANAPGPLLFPQTKYLDRKSRLLVSAVGYTPASCTYEEAMLGANRLVLDWVDGVEEIAYTTAELQDDGTWVLSDLLRNLSCNSQLSFSAEPVDAHVREDFVGTPYPFGANQPTAYYLKGLPPGYDLEQVSPQVATYRGGTARPLSPVNPRYHWNTVTDTVEFSWRRQARQPWPIFSGAAPLDSPENYESYRVQVTDRDTGETREFSVSGPAGGDGRVRFVLSESMWPEANAWSGSFGFTFSVSQVGAFGESPALSKVATPGVGMGGANFPFV